MCSFIAESIFFPIHLYLLSSLPSWCCYYCFSSLPNLVSLPFPVLLPSSNSFVLKLMIPLCLCSCLCSCFVFFFFSTCHYSLFQSKIVNARPFFVCLFVSEYRKKVGQSLSSFPPCILWTTLFNNSFVVVVPTASNVFCLKLVALFPWKVFCFDCTFHRCLLLLVE